MSPADSADRSGPLRVGYGAELEQLRLQIEVMGLRVDQSLEAMREVLLTGNVELAANVLAADDDTDAMNVSLTERCYDVLARENPVAADLRLVVSVIRVSSELERIGDLALRVVKLADRHDLLMADSRSFDILTVMADQAIDLYRAALRAWSADDLALATEVATGSRSIDLTQNQLVDGLIRLEGPDAAAIAMTCLIAGQALERVADHSCILASRLRYLITGDAHHLAAEIRP
jgi:phosphate transport system protein